MSGSCDGICESSFHLDIYFNWSSWEKSTRRRRKLGVANGGGMLPVLVLSASAFNALGVVLVAPITQGGDFARHAGFAASLSGAGTKTQGVALVNQIRMLDLEARTAKRLETVPEFVIDDALARLRAITD
jgi:mRNA interferase ChpB